MTSHQEQLSQEALHEDMQAYVASVMERHGYDEDRQPIPKDELPMAEAVVDSLIGVGERDEHGYYEGYKDPVTGNEVNAFDVADLKALIEADKSHYGMDVNEPATPGAPIDVRQHYDRKRGGDEGAREARRAERTAQNDAVTGPDVAPVVITNVDVGRSDINPDDDPVTKPVVRGAKRQTPAGTDVNGADNKVGSSVDPDADPATPDSASVPEVTEEVRQSRVRTILGTITTAAQTARQPRRTRRAVNWTKEVVGEMSDMVAQDAGLDEFAALPEEEREKRLNTRRPSRIDTAMATAGAAAAAVGAKYGETRQSIADRRKARRGQPDFLERWINRSFISSDKPVPEVVSSNQPEQTAGDTDADPEAEQNSESYRTKIMAWGRERLQALREQSEGKSKLTVARELGVSAVWALDKKRRVAAYEYNDYFNDVEKGKQRKLVRNTVLGALAVGGAYWAYKSGSLDFIGLPADGSADMSMAPDTVLSPGIESNIPDATPPQVEAAPAPDVPAPPAAPEAAQAAPDINLDTPVNPDEPVWSWMQEAGIPDEQIMSRLHEASEKFHDVSGLPVEWHGSGKTEWVEIAGKSDTESILRLLKPYL